MKRRTKLHIHPGPLPVPLHAAATIVGALTMGQPWTILPLPSILDRRPA